jgi:hypothetical protein
MTNKTAIVKLMEIGLGDLRTSKKGTPYLIFNNKSVCYFKDTETYRVFSPHPASQQTRKDFKTLGRLVKYLQQ